MYFENLLLFFIIFFLLSSVFIREGFENCDNLVDPLGKHLDGLRKKNNVDQLLGYTPNEHLYHVLEYKSSNPLPVNANFFNNKY